MTERPSLGTLPAPENPQGPGEDCPNAKIGIPRYCFLAAGMVFIWKANIKLTAAQTYGLSKIGENRAAFYLERQAICALKLF